MVTEGSEGRHQSGAGRLGMASLARVRVYVLRRKADRFRSRVFDSR
jgi:hypothetical protein